MVKNYLVCAIRPTNKTWYRERRNNLHEQYHKMYQMRTASFRKFVQEPFEEILWTEPTEDSDTYTVDNWKVIKELWHREPCNIFWAGADTLMIKPTSLFDGQFKEFRLFNYTDPRSYRNFEHYFNDDVRYYPYTMSDSAWATGENLWKYRESDPDMRWGFDQLRHNTMFWSQTISDADRLHPEMAFQSLHLRDLNPETIKWHEQWNSGCSWGQAHILHFHASRGTDAVINVMQQLCNQLEITL